MKNKRFKVGDKLILKGFNVVTTILNINEEEGYYDSGRYIGDAVILFGNEDKYIPYTEENKWKEEVNEQIQYIKLHCEKLEKLLNK